MLGMFSHALCNLGFAHLSFRKPGGATLTVLSLVVLGRKILLGPCCVLSAPTQGFCNGNILPAKMPWRFNVVELSPKHKQLAVHPKLKAVLPGEEEYSTDLSK